MSLDYPEQLRYLDSHEYIALDGEIATIGLSAFAIEELGEIVFLELFNVDDKVKQGEACGSIESVKAVNDIYAPVSGTVVEQNEAVLETPERLNDDPYTDGWLIKVKVDDPTTALDGTLSADDYKAQLTVE